MKLLFIVLLMLACFTTCVPNQITDYAQVGHCYMQLDTSFVPTNGTETRYKCFQYPSDKHVCLLSSVDAGYQEDNHCANLEKEVTADDLNMAIYADECIPGKTFVPCLPTISPSR